MKRIKQLLLAMGLLPLAAMAQVQSSSGLHIVANGPVKLVFDNTSFINNGSFIPGESMVVFTGSSGNSYISGSGKLNLYNMAIEKPGSLVSLHNNIELTGQLFMNGGNLQLNHYLLDLDRTGSISGENSRSFITGKKGGRIRAVAHLQSPQDVNPGNIGVSISSLQNPGETVIIRGHDAQSYNGFSQGIQRYFDIAPAAGNIQATLRFFYLDDELSDQNEQQLSFYTNKTKGSNWKQLGKDQHDAGGNWVSKNNISLQDRFTLAGSTGTLEKLNIFPNPTAGIVTIQLYSPQDKAAAINLYDAQGRLLERKSLQVKAGVNTVQWNISRYAAGTYHLMFENITASNRKLIKE